MRPVGSTPDPGRRHGPLVDRRDQRRALRREAYLQGSMAARRHIPQSTDALRIPTPYDGKPSRWLPNVIGEQGDGRMDGDRFDTFSRKLASGLSRRGLIKTVAGVGGLLALFESAPAAAKRCSKSCTKEGDRCCAGACVDTTTDTDNCGACGNACEPYEHCKGGVCLCGSNECSDHCCEAWGEPR